MEQAILDLHEIARAADAAVARLLEATVTEPASIDNTQPAVDITATAEPAPEPGQAPDQAPEPAPGVADPLPAIPPMNVSDAIALIEQAAAILMQL